MKNRGDLIASVVCIALGIGVMAGAVHLRVGTPVKPQAGFFPFLGGFLFTALAGILFVQAWRGRSVGAAPFGKLGGVVAVVLGFAFYAATLEVIGYIPATLVLAGVVLKVLGTKSFKELAAITLLVVLGSYLVFQRLLGVSLPAGIIASLW